MLATTTYKVRSRCGVQSAIARQRLITWCVRVQPQKPGRHVIITTCSQHSFWTLPPGVIFQTLRLSLPVQGGSGEETKVDYVLVEIHTASKQLAATSLGGGNNSETDCRDFSCNDVLLTRS